MAVLFKNVHRKKHKCRVKKITMWGNLTMLSVTFDRLVSHSQKPEPNLKGLCSDLSNALRPGWPQERRKKSPKSRKKKEEDDSEDRPRRRRHERRHRHGRRHRR